MVRIDRTFGMFYIHAANIEVVRPGSCLMLVMLLHAADGIPILPAY